METNLTNEQQKAVEKLRERSSRTLPMCDVLLSGAEGLAIVAALQQAQRERDDLRAKLLASEAAGAEMREFIYRTVRALGKPFAWSFAIIEQFVEQANKLLSSTTCGQSFLAERERHVKALEEIAGYGKDGICPYGCDCPNIARTALNPP